MDREKVIKGLECCQIGAIGCQTDCPYSHEESCKIKLINDAISLLKEQEARIRELEEELRALKYGDQDTLKSAMMPAT